MERQHNERADRLRAVLRKMERSIEDARSRRESTESPGTHTPTGSADTHNVRHSPVLDTPIIGRSSVEESEANTSPKTPPPARTQDSMFNFDAPRLKARPKRRPAV